MSSCFCQVFPFPSTSEGWAQIFPSSLSQNTLAAAEKWPKGSINTRQIPLISLEVFFLMLIPKWPGQSSESFCPFSCQCRVPLVPLNPMVHMSIRTTERELCHFIFKLRLDQEALFWHVVVIKQICWVTAAVNTLAASNVSVLQYGPSW